MKHTTILKKQFIGSVMPHSLDMRFPVGARIRVSGDSAELWLTDYNVRVNTEGTVVETPKKTAKKILVTLDSIDGEQNACVLVHKGKVHLINKEDTTTC